MSAFVHAIKSVSFYWMLHLKHLRLVYVKMLQLYCRITMPTPNMQPAEVNVSQKGSSVSKHLFRFLSTADILGLHKPKIWVDFVLVVVEESSQGLLSYVKLF